MSSSRHRPICAFGTSAPERLPALTVVGWENISRKSRASTSSCRAGCAPRRHQRIGTTARRRGAIVDRSSVGARRAVRGPPACGVSSTGWRTAIYGLRESGTTRSSARRLQLERGEGRDEYHRPRSAAPSRERPSSSRFGAAERTGQRAGRDSAATSGVAEIDANRRAALTVLSDLTGVPRRVGRHSRDAEVAPEVARVRAVMSETVAVRGTAVRPHRRVLERQERAVSARDKPRVSAFATSATVGRAQRLSTAFDSIGRPVCRSAGRHGWGDEAPRTGGSRSAA